MLKSKFPLVTIMIPTYNQEQYIENAIESALSQDYSNLEIVISDDNSTDQTGIVIKKYLNDPRIKYFRNTKNLGRVGNYHHTLYDLATGEWVVNLDGDDYFIDNEFISRAIDRILKEDNIVCYFGCKYPKKKLLKEKKRINNYFVFDGTYYFKRFFDIGNFSHARTLYKRSLALKDNKCYSFPGIQSDFHGIIRYCIYGNVIISIEDCVTWRRHDHNQTYSINLKHKYKSERLCQSEIINDLPIPLPNEDIKQWLKDGSKWARRQYINDMLFKKPYLKALGIGIRHYQPTLSHNIILCKVFLRYLGLNVKF